MNLVHLHGHSTFSFLDGYGTPKQIAERIKALGHNACAITDHGNVFAHPFHQKEMKKAGIRPIFGCEFYVTDKMRDREGAVSLELGANSLPHVTILAANEAGYRNLVRLSRLSWEEGFYYRPRVDWNEIARHQEGLIVLSGCIGGYPSRLLLSKGVEEAYSFIAHRRQQIERYYVELIPEPGFIDSHLTLPHLVRIALDLKIPCVMTADAHFPTPEDYEVEDLMVCVGIHKTLKDPERKLKLPEYQYYCTAEELLRRAIDCTFGQQWLVPHFIQAIENSAQLSTACVAELPKASGVIYPGLNGVSAEHELWRWLKEGAVKRKIQGLLPLDKEWEYFERAKHEYDVIQRKGFCDYLLAIADVVNWMKEQGSLVICRGSAGGSVLLWLLGASETDPIRHGLSFERFYDDNRPDPPDVDIDFEKSQRDLAIEYVFEKYGRANCSRLAALSQIGAKGAVQDACFAYGIPRSVFAPLSNALDSKDAEVEKQLGEVTDPAALDVLRRYPQLSIIQKMVGQYRQQSIHAAGVLVSPEPLDTFIGVVLGAGKQPVAAVDKKGAAELGFLKMDFLSVNALDIVGNTVRKLGLPMDWLFTLPLDDQAALRLADHGFLAGVFQLAGGAAARVSKQIGINTFDDVVAASALCRPGPGDWVQMYTEHKANPAKFAAYLSQMHPVARDVVRPTYGILLFQEQVMRLARELAGFDWPLVHQLRKGVVDKVGLDPQLGPPWRAEWSSKFISGCRAGGVGEAESAFWWNSVQSHGGYSFNKAHCVTYGLLGYWMLYLKAHYPGTFYEAYLQLEEDAIVKKQLIREFQALGGVVKLLDPQHSYITFSSPQEGVLVGGYQDLMGIGPVIARKIVEAGPFRDWAELMTALPKGIAQKIEDAGITNGHLDIQSIIQMASWFPPVTMGHDEQRMQAQYGLSSLSLLEPGKPQSNDAYVCGYVTATKFDQDRVIFTLEDQHTGILCRVPLRQVKAVGPKFRELKLADFIATTGWWTGDVFYVKDVVILKKAPVKEKVTKPARKKDG